ncbi:MAG: M48 family metalloprotease [Acutalibacteraceae bacterium]
MSRLFGILKVTLVLALDFFAIYSLFENLCISSIVVGVIALYVLFGGYLALFKEGAVSSKKLPAYQRNRLEAAKAQLAADVKSASGADISGMKLYLVPGDDEMNATAYGLNCISVTRGTFDNTDPITLNAVLAHEICHILNFDAEFNRAVFCSVTLLVGALSIMSFATLAVIFLLFLLLSCFSSWLGVMAFHGTTKAVGGIFSLLQRGVVMIYRSLLGLVSRHAEYRSDKYSCTLGYGIQLSHFLAVAEPANQRQLTLTEAMYRSHPPAAKRIARLEKQLFTQKTTEITNR